MAVAIDAGEREVMALALREQKTRVVLDEKRAFWVFEDVWQLDVHNSTLRLLARLSSLPHLNSYCGCIHKNP